jgi:hypothetical protein
MCMEMDDGRSALDRTSSGPCSLEVRSSNLDVQSVDVLSNGSINSLLVSERWLGPSLLQRDRAWL